MRVKRTAGSSQHHHLAPVKKASFQARSVTQTSHTWATSQRLATIERKYGADTVNRVIQACERMWELKKDLGIAEHDLFKLSLFIETKLITRIQKGKFYLSSEQTKLAKSIEYDPKTKLVFIHHFGKIGEGWHKKVYTSIKYDTSHPELVARCVVDLDDASKKEIAIVKKLKDEPGIAKTYAVLERTDPQSHKEIATIIQKLYSGHSLYHYQHNPGELSKKEMVIIARDIAQGLDAIHRHDLVHRDLHGGNILLADRANGVAAAIIDFGQAAKNSSAKEMAPGIEVPRRFNPPDAFWRTKENINAKAVDVYAMGLNLYHLYYGKQAEWAVKEKFAHINDMSKTEKVIFRKKLEQKMLQQLDSRRHELSNQKDPINRFAALILQMCDPSPFKRPTAHEAAKRLNELVCEIEGK